MATAKQAGISKVLGQMGKSLRIAAKKTGRGIKKVGPSAAAGAAGGAAGYSFGHGRGYDKGHGEGYSTGSREGGSNAMRNLFKGLMDLQRAGGTSKADLQKELNLGEIKKAAVRIHRTKLARHVLRLHALQQAINVYDAAGLRKAAAFGTHKDERVKYAQLQLQYYTEKRAFLGALTRGVGLLGKGIRAGAGILGQMGRGVGQGARQMGSAIGLGADKGMQLGRIAGKQMQRAAQPMLGRMQGFGQHVSQLGRDPALAGVTGGAAGLLGGYAAGNAYGQGQAVPRGNSAGTGGSAAGTGLQQPSGSIFDSPSLGVGIMKQLNSYAGNPVGHVIKDMRDGLGRLSEHLRTYGRKPPQQTQPPAGSPQAKAAPPRPAPPKPVGGMWPSH